jgi:signal transduction histidine kinase
MFKEEMMKSFNNLSLMHLKYRVKAEDGYQWHLIHAKPEKMPDKSVVWYGSFHNINDRIEYEKAMEQIAFDISHVLRRPVTSLMGLNSLIDTEKDLSKEKLLEYVKHIKTVALEMDSFTSGLNKVYNKKQEVIMNQRNGYTK